MDEMQFHFHLILFDRYSCTKCIKQIDHIEILFIPFDWLNPVQVFSKQPNVCIFDRQSTWENYFSWVRKLYEMLIQSC